MSRARRVGRGVAVGSNMGIEVNEGGTEGGGVSDEFSTITCGVSDGSMIGEGSSPPPLLGSVVGGSPRPNPSVET